jgi:hypothetical protein
VAKKDTGRDFIVCLILNEEAGKLVTALLVPAYDLAAWQKRLSSTERGQGVVRLAHILANQCSGRENLETRWGPCPC